MVKNIKKSSIIIGIDANEANVKNRVGVNQFAFELLWEIYRTKRENSDFLIFLSEAPSDDLPPATDWWQYEVFGPKIFWTWLGLTKRLFFGKPKPDVVFSPSHYGPGFSPASFVISIMDLGFLRWRQQFTKKDYFQLKYWTKWSVKRAKKIITISEYSKKDIVNTYKVEPDKVVVAYPGHKRDQRSLAAVGQAKIKDQRYRVKLKNLKDKYKIEDNYLLYLGTLKPSKNIEGLIWAFNILISHYSNVQLVIIGKKGWLYEKIFTLVEKLKLKDKVVFTGFISNEEKEILLSGAKAFVLPSFWEGFGIPVLEAMVAGVPVICSAVASLPEVAGEAAIYIENPHSVDSIYKALEKVVKLEEKERKELIEKGFEQIKKFSWKKCAQKILETLEEIGGKNAN